MAEINTVIAEASQDLQTIEDFVNLPADSEVYPRLLPSVNVGTLAGTRDAIFRAGGLPATPFATKALMTASALVDGKYAQVTDDTVNNGLYVKTSGAWVKSSYSPEALMKSENAKGKYFDAKVWFFNPYYEFVPNNALYVKFLANGLADSRIGYIMDTRLVSAGQRIYMNRDQYEAMLTSNGITKVTSPRGVTDCLKLTGTQCLVYDLDTNELLIKGLEDAGNHIILVGIDGVNVAKGVETSRVRHQIAMQGISDVRATALSDAAMGVIDIWCWKPYYEFTTGNTAPFYFKPTSYNGYAIFCYDARFGSVLITVNQVYAAIRDYCTRTDKPESDFIMTSPKGVVECIKFYDNYSLFYSIKNKNIYFAPRFDKDPENLHVNNPSVKIIASDGTIWGVCEERVNLLKSYTLQKLSELATNSNVAASDLDGIRGVAHRGYSSVAPENTLPAYILAKKNGFDYVECDILFTSDNVPVLLHDDTIDRTSNGTGAINSLTLAQVKALDFGSWKNATYAGTQIPTLEEFLNLCRVLELHPYLEMKAMTNTQALAVAAVVDKCQMNGRVSFISFTYSALQTIASVKPTARLGFVTTGMGATVVDNTDALRTGSNQVFLDLQAKVVNQTLLDTIALAAAKQIPVEMWTVNDATAAVEYVEAGVTGITTDVVIIEDEIALKYGLNT